MKTFQALQIPVFHTITGSYVLLYEGMISKKKLGSERVNTGFKSFNVVFVLNFVLLVTLR